MLVLLKHYKNKLMDGNMISSNQPRGGNRHLGRILITILIIALLILGGAILFRYKFSGLKTGDFIKSDYQAVFLTNGQVYFGKLEIDRGWIVLKDIYYLQVKEDLQAATGSTTPPTSTNNNQQQSIQLVKLGSELHGPEDTMYIAKDKILFWENMKDDSKVLESIRADKNK
jgi:hypothetical protein